MNSEAEDTQRSVATRREAAAPGSETAVMQVDASSRRIGSIIVVGAIASLLLVGFVLQPVPGTGGKELSLFGVTLPAVCLFRRATGLPCASCGLTRSVVLLLHGRLGEAVALHPFGPIALALAIGQLPPRLTSLGGRPRPWTALWDWSWNRSAVTAFVLMLLWWASRAGRAAIAFWAAG